MGPGSPRGHRTFSMGPSPAWDPAAPHRTQAGRELGELSKTGNRFSTERQKQQQLKMKQQENMNIRNLESIRTH